ncbi:MAG: hypothetical protein IT382_06845 [Deltaproteobacteria bacterium]|nr:hypothetical protein [Deltaproteobacteria bacterium]
MGSSTAATVGPEGGRIELGGLRLEIGGGALQGAEEITLQVEDGELPGEGPGYSHLYRFGPEGLAFEAPVKVTLPFSGAPALAAVFWSSEANPDVFKRVEAVFDGAYATVEVSHFSRGSVRNTCSFGSCGCTKDSDCTAGDIDKCDGSYSCKDDLTSQTGQKKCALEPSTVVSCDDSIDTACYRNQCQPATGLCAFANANEGGSCDDGYACTVADSCAGGECVPGASQCGCQKDKDCAAQEDGDLCNGKLYCNKAQFPYVCSVNPATTVVCNDDDDTTCSRNTCNPTTGTCSMVDQSGSCDDGKSCTSGDACQDGVCQSGEFVCQCQQNSDCVALEDGDLCNGTLYCQLNTGECLLNPTTVISCQSVNDTTCAQNLCQPGTGQCAMTPAPNGTSCDDGNTCTTGDTCQAGQCQSGAPSCECTSNADCGALEDGNLCNGTLYCNLATHTCLLNPATVISCPSVDDTDCLQNTCQPATGQCAMSALANDTSCTDGNDCTVVDTCQGGSCQPGADQCQCQQDVDCAPYDDDEICNGSLYCDKSQMPFLCIVNPGTVVTCDSSSDTECTQNTCDEGSGQCALAAVNEGGTCDDGERTTDDDRCFHGLCMGINPLLGCVAQADCHHLNTDPTLCIGYGCDIPSGSCIPMVAPDGGQCDLDNDSCTDDQCVAGVCQPGADQCPP